MDNNAIILIAAAVFAVVLFVLAYRFLGEEKVKKWLRWAVLEAEKDLQSGTGEAKLVRVYSLLIVAFPKFSKILPYRRFEKLVDCALVWMDELLANNPIIASTVYSAEITDKHESEAVDDGNSVEG